MSNDSSTGGFLAPTPPDTTTFAQLQAAWAAGTWEGVPPLAGVELYRFIQYVVAGITGLAGTLVFPRWQPEPPNLPDGDWAALGINRSTATGYPYIDHDPAGKDRFQRHEILSCLVSFYGDNSEHYATTLRDGLTIPQNNEPFLLAGFGFVSADEVTALPSLVKQRWLYRSDLTFTVMREIRRTYPVLNVERVLTNLRTSEGFTSSILAPPTV